MKTPDCFSVFEYLYRDASNFKAHGSILLAGQPSAEIQDAIRAKLLDHELFIPERVGIPSLQHLLWEYSDGPTADDHPWHEFVALREARPEDMTQHNADISLTELASRFTSVDRWDAIPCTDFRPDIEHREET